MDFQEKVIKIEEERFGRGKVACLIFIL